MQVLDRLRDLFDAMGASPFGPWLGLAALATAVLFFITAGTREAVDKALSLRQSGRPLRLFDLSHGDAERAMADKVAVAPERLWTYDEEYLDHFVQQSLAASVGSRKALEAYRDTVLRWDIAFALTMTAFIVLFWLDVATATWAPPWLARLAILAECMGVLYGFADVAEDVKLRAILDDGHAIVDPAEVAAANALTRVKFAAIALSVVGALMFAVLTVADRLLSGLFGVLAGIMPVARRLFSRLAPASTG
ncbi:MAG TPA: hypothetical protein VNU65_04010 [Xanthobacteraceae bacterium]|jgi:hypothetical protein|nr:hypothetical protein [Xanthobacteraceae bacterium]